MAPWLSQLVFESTEHVTLVRIAALSLAFESLILVPQSMLQVKRRSVTYVVTNATKLVLQLALNVTLVIGLGMGPKGVLLSTLIANVIVGSFLAAYHFREVGFSVSRTAVRDLVRFGLPFIATQAATLISQFGSRPFLQRSADETAVGLFSVAYEFVFILLLVGFQPFNAIWAPTRFEVAKRPDRDHIYAHSFIYSNVVLLLVAVGIAAFVDPVIRVIAAPEFHSAAKLVPLLLLASIFQAWSETLNTGILIRERTGYIALANYVAAAVALLGYFTLIPRWLGLGAAIATVVAFAVRFVMIYVISQRLWPVAYQWGPVWRALGAAAAVSIAGVFAAQESTLVSMGIGVVLVGVFVGAVWFLGVLSAEDRAVVRQIIATPRAALQILRGEPVAPAES